MEILGNLFEHEEEDYYKPVRVDSFWSNNYIEYESNGCRNKTLSIGDYLNKIRTYWKYIINDLTKVVNFMSSKDNDAERVMHSKIDNIEIMTNDKVNEVTE